ncbi:hypothetical protein Sango_2887200 [Sesamum angolense]|uniref:Reverse transcriptase domain-containing protein n=1 Tax=Sesamum angolense TaxID=2727404 RepID=A0AAE1T6W7_9LAMI|nr:hypothetical protein Sango_2887200 [Sesamum angolense]
MSLRRQQHTHVPVWICLKHSDGITKDCSRLDYARVCVMLNYNSELPKHLVVISPVLRNGKEDPKRVDVEYEWLPQKCTNCCSLGHVEHIARRLNAELAGAANSVSNNSRPSGLDKGKAIALYNSYGALDTVSIEENDDQFPGPNQRSPTVNVQRVQRNLLLNWSWFDDYAGPEGRIWLAWNPLEVGVDILRVESQFVHCRAFNKRLHTSDGPRSLWKRLDRMLANTNWTDAWSSSSYISALPSISDHSPLILTGMERGEEHVVFRFDNYLAHLPGFLNSVEEIWKHRIVGTAMYETVCKLKLLKSVFRQQKRLKGNLTENVRQAKNFLDKAQALFSTYKEDIFFDLVKSCRRVYSVAVKLEISMLQQRAKLRWLKHGDQSSKIFFRKINTTRVKQRIFQITKVDGELLTAQHDVNQEFISYFQNIFGAPSIHRSINLEFLRHELKHTITTAEASLLVTPVTLSEVKEAFFDIDVESAPGPDGYTSAFFRNAWPGRWYVSDYRPIACCNVLYKSITKIIVKRLQQKRPVQAPPTVSKPMEKDVVRTVQHTVPEEEETVDMEIGTDERSYIDKGKAPLAKCDIMNAAFWNVRGLNRRDHQVAVKELVNEFRLNFLGLLETRVSAVNVLRVQTFLPRWSWFTDYDMPATVVYGANDSVSRRGLWQSLVTLADSISDERGLLGVTLIQWENSFLGIIAVKEIVAYGNVWIDCWLMMLGYDCGRIRIINVLTLRLPITPHLCSEEILINIRIEGTSLYAVTRKLRALKPVFRTLRKKKEDLSVNVKLAAEFLATVQQLLQIDRHNSLLLRLEKCCKLVFFKATKLEQVNTTILALIPKRLRLVLDKMISPSQNAFVPGRSIGDNILLAQELCAGYNRQGLPMRCTLKVDLRKAYETVEWDFLSAVLQLFGFPGTFIGWVEECVTTPMFSVCINGNPHGFFKGSKGLRQGDPLFPFLFVLIMEVLQLMLLQLIDQNEGFSFHWRCKELGLFQLCFADDLLLFCKADVASVRVFRHGLDEFAKMSGLHANPQKSQLILSRSAQDVREQLLAALHFQEGHLPFRMGKHSVVLCGETSIDQINKFKKWTKILSVLSHTLHFLHTLILLLLMQPRAWLPWRTPAPMETRLTAKMELTQFRHQNRRRSNLYRLMKNKKRFQLFGISTTCFEGDRRRDADSMAALLNLRRRWSEKFGEIDSNGAASHGGFRSSRPLTITAPLVSRPARRFPRLPTPEQQALILQGMVVPRSTQPPALENGAPRSMRLEPRQAE